MILSKKLLETNYGISNTKITTLKEEISNIENSLKENITMIDNNKEKIRTEKIKNRESAKSLEHDYNSLMKFNKELKSKIKDLYEKNENFDKNLNEKSKLENELKNLNFKYISLQKDYLEKIKK